MRLDVELVIVAWGTNDRSIKTPVTLFGKLDRFEAGVWGWLNPEPVRIVAMFIGTNGSWFGVPDAI